MSQVNIPYRFRVRRRTAASWTSLNEILLDSEIGRETDTERCKMGDGVTAWNSLKYIIPGRYNLIGLSDGDTLIWDAAAQEFIVGPGGGSPITDAGDMIFGYADSNGDVSPDRLPIGDEDDILKVVSGLPTWVPDSGGGVTAVAAGHGVDVDATNPAVPIVIVDETELDSSLVPFSNSAFSAANVEDAIVEASTMGASGGVSPALQFTADTGSTADSDPGAGLLKWDNATQASATFLYVDDDTVDGVSMTGCWAVLNPGGFIYFQHATDQDTWQLWRTTAVTDASGYVKLAVGLMANGGSFADGDPMRVMLQQGPIPASSPIGLHMVPVMAGYILPSVTGGATAATAIASAGSQPDIVTVNFNQTTQQFAQFAIPMPKSWDHTSTITALFNWSHAATTTNFGVEWGIQCVAVSDNDAINQAFGTAQVIADTGGVTNRYYRTSQTPAMTPGGSPAQGDTLFFRISRNPAAGGDTMAIAARLHSVELYITTNAANDA